MMNDLTRLPGSFRDPCGHVFIHDGQILRSISHEYKEHYDFLTSSGLYDRLVEEGVLIPHVEDSLYQSKDEAIYKYIFPQKIPFISYPYEWCFHQYKNAALALLKVQKIALQYGMILKDSSAYNIQFWNGKPIFIDTLSFEKYEAGKPWFAYSQFCRHFLSPLLLMSYKDPNLGQLMRIYLDGIPIPFTSKLLPLRSIFRPSILFNIHIQSKFMHSNQKMSQKYTYMKKDKLEYFTDFLIHSIERLSLPRSDSFWSQYYEDNSYSEEAFQNKKNIVYQYIERIQPEMVWDLGSNTGYFSRLTSERNIYTISFDSDITSVAINYIEALRNHEKYILPLFLDLNNPSPGIGWMNRERASLIERGPVDAILALALLHHLAIGNNVPFEMIALFFSQLCKNLIVEFVPKTDKKVQEMLLNRKDIFSKYNQDEFEFEFKKYFQLEDKIRINQSERILYLYKKR